ncbi:2-oxoadipate dioxygenase/decarboxylase HglS [Pseudorhodoferax soli]|uniref:2-oxoadipate dioxygenase/decarboxylase n=1 Tax=Pseudorhodoferax soli TaxID=545864 RepID=A0A368XQ49_9BURK|nr:VOC family protein [Pseudorhodoferax soli]RCW70093.1 putative glyoxalase superfamily metalloenzyme YdcJ [Pseudorhodoferax soli]
MPTFASSDQIRDQFSRAMSAMYKTEVPQYGTLLDLVADINRATLADDGALRAQLETADELRRLDVERHGAIRLGTARELADMRRIFRVMGMHPVGYYDLSVAGVPVHATAFRPVDDAALRTNPFRVFTSLLRLELIADPALREEAQAILARRAIFTPRALALTALAEEAGGLTKAQAAEFVQEVTQTFRWHSEATVSHARYRQLHAAHRLVADVVSFKGPHINHLTPRTLDIDAAQAEMPRRGIAAKEVVEGPPRRKHAILLRQTSFKALEEPIVFADDGADGSHSARFGEIEQRGMALTRAGRALYDELLAGVRSMQGAGSASADYSERLAAAFRDFPDDLDQLLERGLAFFRWRVLDADGLARVAASGAPFDLQALRAKGLVAASPIVYEDFLPVSAAGIFQSNLGGAEQKSYAANAAQEAFEAALGAPVADEIALYAQSQQASIDTVRAQYQAAVLSR